MTDVAEGSAAGVDESVVDARGHVPGESSMWFFVIGDLLIFAVYFGAIYGGILGPGRNGPSGFAGTG